MKARIKRIKIHPEALVAIMANDSCWRVEKGLPKNAKVRGACLDPYTMMLNVFVEHESFEEVSLREVAPLLETRFRKVQ
jgi:hypothetical protein